MVTSEVGKRLGFASRIRLEFLGLPFFFFFAYGTSVKSLTPAEPQSPVYKMGRILAASLGGFGMMFVKGLTRAG